MRRLIASLCVSGVLVVAWPATGHTQRVVVLAGPMANALGDALEQLEQLDGEVRTEKIPEAQRESLRRTIDKSRAPIKSALSNLGQPRGGDRRTAVDARTFSDALSDASRALRRLGEDLDRSPKLARDRKKLLTKRVRVALVRLADAGDRIREAKPPPKVSQKTEAFAMDSKSFQGLITRLEGTSFESDRLDLIRAATRSNLFTCDQVIALVSTLEFEHDRVSAAEALYPRTSNKRLWFKVYSAFALDSSQGDLRARLAR